MAGRFLSGRIGTALLPAAGVFLRAMGRAARQLLHEVTGALFALFAVIGGVSAWRAWQQGPPGWTVALSLGFAGMMAYFAATAFWRARHMANRKRKMENRDPFR